MPKQMSPEDRRKYMREWRARRKVVVLGEAGPETVVTEAVKPETGPTLAEKGQKPRKTVRNAKKAVEEAQIPENDLETTLKRQRSGGTKWINPFDDGLDDTGYLIQRMSQHARDKILDRVNVTKQR